MISQISKKMLGNKNFISLFILFLPCSKILGQSDTLLSIDNYINVYHNIVTLNQSCNKRCLSSLLDFEHILKNSTNPPSPENEIFQFFQVCQVNSPPIIVSNDNLGMISPYDSLINNICLIIRSDALQTVSDSLSKIPLSSIESRNSITLCKDDYFKKKYSITPTNATPGTGIAINDSTIITAKHVVPTIKSLDSTIVFIFQEFINWNNQEDSFFLIEKKNIYYGKLHHFKSGLEISRATIKGKIKNVKTVEIDFNPSATDSIISFGYPYATPLAFHNISTGWKERSYTYRYRTNLNVYPNNSGSPVVNAKSKKLVGVVTNAPSCLLEIRRQSCCFLSRNTCKKIGMSYFNHISELKEID